MKKSKIKGTKALNKATTLIPPKGKKWKGEFDDGGYMDRQDASRKQAQQGVGAIPVWGQLAGATMSISDGIRQDQSDPTANAVANVISPSSGIRNAYESGHSEDMLVAAFNPIGGGVLAAQRTEEDRLKRQAQMDAVTTRRLIDNSGGAFRKGGKISTYPKVQSGGYLKPVSEDAVEVVGNNPSLVDDVELENAFVDNNEVIDKENRVFSDEIVGPNGMSIAKNAKRLEKMKGSDSRFKPSNDRIDGKINDLFNFQEQIKKITPQARPITTAAPPSDPFAATRKAQKRTNFGRDFNKEPYKLQEYRMHRQDPDYRDYRRYPMTASEWEGMAIERAKETGDNTYLRLKGLYNPMPQPRFKNGGRLKSKYAKGGVYKYNPMDFSSQEGQMDLNPGGNTFDTSGNFNQTTQGSQAPSFDWQSAATTAAAFAPNVANIFARNKLKGPAAPQMEATTKLSRVSADSQLAEAGRQARLAQQVINRNTSQGSNLAAATGSILAKRLANQNQIHGDINRLNASIGAQEAMINTGIGARNTERTNAFTQAQNDFANMKTRLTTENIANASNKFQVMGRERNQMKRDQQDFQLIQESYGDSGVLARLWRDNPELAASIENSMGKKSGSITKPKSKMGGRIAKLYKGKC